MNIGLAVCFASSLIDFYPIIQVFGEFRSVIWLCEECMTSASVTMSGGLHMGKL